MKNVNSLIATFLIIQMGLATANEVPFEVLDENKIITELNNEKDLSKKDNVYNSLRNSCPFREENTQLNELIRLNNELDASSKNSYAVTPECESYVKDINASVLNTQKMLPLINNPNSKMDPALKQKYTQDLNTTIMGTSSLHSLLQSQCSVQNNNAIISRTNQTIGDIERWSAALAIVNPVAGLVGVGAASVGRLAVGLKGWISRKPKSNSASEIKESERFVNDLCMFRTLTYQYDKIISESLKVPVVINPEMNIDPQAEQRLLDRKAAIKNELIGIQDMISCTQTVKASTDSLQEFSKKLAPFLDRPASQKECINILNNYLDLKSTTELGPIDTLAQRYKCSEPTEVQSDRRYTSFCKNYQLIEKMSEGDLYEKCEDETFQKGVSTKFTSLTDLILRNIQDDMKAVAPAEDRIKGLESDNKSIDDQLQILRENEQRAKALQESNNGLQAALKISRTTDLNTSKGITNIGRNILGNRFDLFAQSSLKSAEFDIREASKGLKELVKQSKKIDGNSFFPSRKITDEKKEELKKDICRNALQIKRQFINGYKSSAGIKDICDFTKGDGIPPLESLGQNFDSYSASVSNRVNNISNKCVTLGERISKNNNDIREQMNVISGLGCGI